MKHRMNEIVSGVLFVSVVSAAVAAPATTRSADWLPVDQDVWAVMMEAPQAHLLRAKEDVALNDFKGAAKEIRMANSYLFMRERMIGQSHQQLDGMANRIQSGKLVSPKDLDDAFSSAGRVLDYRMALVPVMSGADTLYRDEADYHLAQAKKHLNKKDNKSAAGDIRKAEAYLKLKAVHAGEKAKSDLSTSAAELEGLAGKVETGADLAAKDIEQAFDRAHKAVRSAL